MAESFYRCEGRRQWNAILLLSSGFIGDNSVRAKQEKQLQDPMKKEDGREFSIGDRVVKNPADWVPNDFDGWGRGEGVGIVVEPPFPLEPGCVDVRWPAGRCFEDTAGLAPAPPQDRQSDKQ